MTEIDRWYREAHWVMFVGMCLAVIGAAVQTKSADRAADRAVEAENAAFNWQILYYDKQKEVEKCAAVRSCPSCGASMSWHGYTRIVEPVK